MGRAALDSTHSEGETDVISCRRTRSCEQVDAVGRRESSFASLDGASRAQVPPGFHRRSTAYATSCRRMAGNTRAWKSISGITANMVLVLVAATCVHVVSASPYSLGIVADGPCNGLTTWAQGDCKIFAGEDIPAFTVGLFDSNGVACCGEAEVQVNSQSSSVSRGLNLGGPQVSVQAMVSKSNNAVLTTGYLDRDSEIGDTMQVTFSGIRLAGTEAGSDFAITFSAFYNGYFLTYVTPSFSIMPNRIELERPWGTWGDYLEFDDEGPWQVNEVLPDFSVALTVLNTTGTSIIAADNFYIGARLFDKNTLADISTTSLTGTTRMLVDNGKATFSGLRVGLVAGSGFRMSFFLEGSDRPCLPTILRAVCDEWEAQRGLVGGLGGYETETMSGDITIYPDLLSLSISGRHPPILRVDETMFTYSVQFFDSQNPGAAIANFVPTDDFTVTASLFNGDGVDISSWGLDGTKTVAPSGDAAVFDNLVVRGTAGAAFTLQFKTSWNTRCELKLVDTACTGRCCIATAEFFVFPYSIQLSPSSFSAITEGTTLPDITVSFQDFSGSVLTGISAGDRFQITPYLRKRGNILSIQGERTIVVDNGVAVFSNLTIAEEAGSLFTILFEEDTSQISAVTSQFPVYGTRLELESETQYTINAGEDLEDVAVRVLGARNQTLSSIESEDGFTITVRALKWDGSAFVNCGCIEGDASERVDGGVARLLGSNLTVRSTIGLFQLEARQTRTALATLSVRTIAFSVLPASLILSAPTLQVAYSTGQTINQIDIAFADVDGSPVPDVNAADGVVITASLLYGGQVVPPGVLAGGTVQTVDGGVATFADLVINGAAGSGYQLMFVFVDAVEGSVLTVNSSAFSLRPNQLSINNTRPDGITNELLPPMFVSLDDGAGGRLVEIAAADAFVVSAELIAGTLLGCLPADQGGITAYSLNLNASQCKDAANDALAHAFMTGFGPNPSAAFEAELARVAAGQTDGGGNDWRVLNVSGGCGRVQVHTGDLWRWVCPSTFAAEETDVLCSFLGLGAGRWVDEREALAGNATLMDCALGSEADPSLCSLTPRNECPSGQVAELCCAGLEAEYEPLCAFDFTGEDPEGDCGGGEPCWLVESVAGWSAGSDGCGVNGICCGGDCACSPQGGASYSSTSEMAVYGLVNRTDKLLGTKAALVSEGRAQFFDLRVTEMFGSEAFWLRYTDNGDLLTRNTSTAAFSVDPPRLVVRGVNLASKLVADPFANVSVSLTDLNGRPLTPTPLRSGQPFASQPYTVTVSATHTTPSFSEDVPLLNGVSRVVEGSSANFTGLKIDARAGSGFRLTFTLDRAVGSVSVTTRNFTVFPDVLALPSGPLTLSNLSGPPMPSVTLECQTVDGQVLSGIREDDGLTVHVDVLDRNGSVLPVCPMSGQPSCVAGTVDVTVVNGTATFDNVLILNTAGTGFKYRYSMPGGGPSVDSPTFSVFPGQMVIAEGIDDFFGQYWVVNRGVGDYAIRLQSPSTGAHSAAVTTSDGFNISATLEDTQSGDDITGSMHGQKWVIANYDAGRGVHAVFTDLVMTYAGEGLQLRFRFTDTSSSLEVSTTTFRAVPYALRISQRCYNGNAINTSRSVAFGVPELSCVGTDPGAPSDFGVYGFLTGYYYYVDNNFIGPLLRTVQGSARIPTIEVTATDLFGVQMADVSAADDFQIQVDLYQNAVEFSSELGGTVRVALDGGAATFDDLTVGNVTGCEPSCEIALRFSLVGTLCQDTWCTNVSMTLQEATITAPQSLGSHPAFPGRQSVGGVAVIPTLGSLSVPEQDLFRSALVAFSGVRGLASSDVTIVSASNATSRRLLAEDDLEVTFSIAARTFAQASAIYAGVTAFLDSGTAVFGQVCSAAELATVELCNKTVTLKEPLTREVVSLLLSSRVPTPTFAPLGSSSTCVGSSSCVEANFSSAFGSFSVTITTDAGSTVYYTMDTCPTPTSACTATGSVLSTSSSNISSGTPIAVITSSPTDTILPVGLSTEDAVPADGPAFGASGLRYVAEMPTAFTVKAYGIQDGKKAGFQGSATYALPPQAATPEITLKTRYTLGWCNGTAVTSGGGPPHVVPGPCASLHSNGTECNAALAVPCKSYGFVCSSGLLGYTIAGNGVYDGAFVPGGTSTLTVDYGAGQSSVFVTSLAALGFVNDGALPTPRSIQVGVNGQGGSGFAALTVTAVEQATSSLTVDVDLTTSFAAAGSEVVLLDSCEVGGETQTVTVELASSTAGVQLYYTLDASSPSPAALVLASPGTLSFRLPANLTVVAAGGGYIDSYPLAVDFVAPCGDGTQEGGEQCDDGNRVDGDGCSSDCVIE